jgi:hypothetical protein
MYDGTGPAAARGSASRRRRGQYVRTEWGQFESSGVSKSVAVLSDSVGAHTRAAAPEVVPFSDQSGATALSPDAGQSGSFRSSRVIAVNTRAAARWWERGAVRARRRWNEGNGV